MRHARNDFSRWDAAQSLLATYIKLNVARHQQGQPLSLPVHVADAFRAVLLDEKIDPALAAEILTLPSVNEMAELFDIIDPIAIAEVREALTRTPVSYTHLDVYKRQLPGRCCSRHTSDQ